MKATQTIWRTVVFAGAMLGAGACHSKKATTGPNNTTTDTAKTGDATTAKPDPTNATPPDGTGDPCGGGERTRGTDTNDNGGGHGRGFILS